MATVLIERPGYKKFRVADLNLNIVGNPVYGERTHRDSFGPRRMSILVRAEKISKPSVVFTYEGEDYIMPLMNSKGNVIQASVFNYDRIIRSSSIHKDESEVDSDTRETLRKLSGGAIVEIHPTVEDGGELLKYVRKFFTVVPSKTTMPESDLDEELEITKLMIFCAGNA